MRELREETQIYVYLCFIHALYTRPAESFLQWFCMLFCFVFDCVICHVRLSVDFSACDVIQVIRKVQISEC